MNSNLDFNKTMRKIFHCLHFCSDSSCNRQSKLHSKVSTSILQGLQSHELILDAQLISLNELSVIASFLTSKEAYLHLQRVRLYKPSSNDTINPPRVEIAGTSRLLRLLIKFIVKSHGLLGIFLESFTISPDSLDKLGMSISKTKSSKFHRPFSEI